MASGPITLWQIEGEKVAGFLFLSSKITVYADCSHESIRWLILGRKAMTNLDSVLKSNDITLPTKIYIVKSMAFPVDMCRCESWTTNMAECQKNWCVRAWCWRKCLRVPWTARRLNQSIIKEVNPEYTPEGLMVKLKLQHSGHLMRIADSLEKTLMLGQIEGRRRRGQQRMRWLDGITRAMDMNLGKLQEIVRDREAWRAAAPGATKIQTQLGDWTTTCNRLLKSVCWSEWARMRECFENDWKIC